jgi:hypothetical protein
MYINKVKIVLFDENDNEIRTGTIDNEYFLKIRNYHRIENMNMASLLYNILVEDIVYEIGG